MTKITSAGDLQSIAKAYNDAKAGFSHHIYTCGGGACVSSGCIATRDAAAEYLKEKGVKVTVATKVSEGSPNILDDIKEGRISMVINTTNHGRDAERDGFKIRRSTVEHAIACLTSMDTARELQHVMSAMRRRRVVSIVALQDLAWEG